MLEALICGPAPSPIRSPRSCGDYCCPGGKNKSNLDFGLIRSVRAYFGGVSYKIHRRLDLRKFRPTTSIDWTIFYHFCPHLTPKGFSVNKKVYG